MDSLIALRAAPPSISAADAQQLALALYGLSGQATALHGERDGNFRLTSSDGRDWLLKVMAPATDDKLVECHALALAHLAEQAPQLPVPRIILTQGNLPVGVAEMSGEHYRVLMMQFMPGEPAVATVADTALLGVIGRTLGRLDYALRGFFHASLLQPIVWDVRQSAALLAYVDYLDSPVSRQLVRTAIESVANQRAIFAALRAQAIHGDFHPCNILLNQARDACSGIIDFGDMIHAPLVFEPAVTMAEFLIQGTARLEQIGAILAGYCNVESLEGEDIDVLYDVISARIATALLVYAWRCHHDQAGAQATADSFAFAEASLAALSAIGRDTLTREWHRMAGTSSERVVPTRDASLLERRHRLLGANAELSYDEPLHLVRAAGVWLYGADGQRYLDVYNNVPHVGHSHPAVVNAVRAQASRIASNTRYLDEVVLDYAERLAATLSDGLDVCLFVNSGSEANDIAWRIAQLQTGHHGALVMSHAYHGITEAVTALSPEVRRTNAPHVECLAVPPDRQAVGNLSEQEVSSLAARDVERALAALKQRGFGLAAFFFDSAFTSNGVYDPPQAWMTAIAAAVRAAGGLIVGDEVQFGLGRSGTHFWGFDRRGCTPDIVTLGKPVGNGYPIGVVVTHREILERFQAQTGFFSTFGGNPVAAAAGLAVLNVIEHEQLMSNALQTGSYFRERLEQLAKRHEMLGELRGSGLLLGMEVLTSGRKPAPRRARAVVNDLRRRGVLIGSAGPQGHVLKLRPPIIFSREHVDYMIDALADVLANTGLSEEGEGGRGR